MLILEQMVDGLNAIHKQDQMHRDIKPANIFLISGFMLDNIIVKLGDFGLARKTGYKDLGDYTKGVGSDDYKSPEVLLNLPYGSQNDVWALGIVFYEMLARRHPFKGKDKLGRIKNAEPDPLPEWVPVDIVKLVTSLLEKDPLKRPSTLEIMQTILTRKLGAFKFPKVLKSQSSNSDEADTSEYFSLGVDMLSLESL